jgi:hypothetical protein
MPAIVFPSEPFEPRKVDSAFEHEHEAALSAGFSVGLVDHTLIVGAETGEAVKRVRVEGPATYRGWMLTVPQYATLYGELSALGVQLVNSPERYAFCHQLPNSYATLAGETPRSVWYPLVGDPDFGAVRACAAQLGSGAAVLKDYVKSQKHYWEEACFIPDVADGDRVEAVVRRFLELQGSELNGGLVFREFVPLKIVGVHPQSGMPLAAEFRSFWLNGELVLSHKYWGGLTSFEVELPLAWMRDLVGRIDSAFFTMDVAMREDGTWVVIELGDGQVAGLPSQELAPEFFSALHRVGAQGTG